jgi:ketosteroid isomerase-like protein
MAEEQSPKRRFYEDQIRYLQAGDVDGLVDDHYTEDARFLSFDHRVEGNAALKEFFRGYLQMIGTLDVLSTDQFVESDDSLFFQATMKTNLGEATVFDAWVLRDGKISHHFAGVYP